MTETRATETAVEPRLDEGGAGDVHAHYADKTKITEAAVLGTPVTALCGKKWVPHRDPSRYPVCPRCRELYAVLRDLS